MSCEASRAAVLHPGLAFTMFCIYIKYPSLLCLMAEICLQEPRPRGCERQGPLHVFGWALPTLSYAVIKPVTHTTCGQADPKRSQLTGQAQGHSSNWLRAERGPYAVHYQTPEIDLARQHP